ncbi:MAG: CPBP family intramembrane glutamic endopeptidase [Candidatus Hermodarchaeota archaeon]
MNEKQVPESDKNHESGNSKDKSVLNENEWSFCPVCGNKIPKIQNLQFCVRCGTNLKYLKQHKNFLPKKETNPYIQASQYPSSLTPITFYGPEKISDDDIINTIDKRLWGTTTSIGIPLGSFLLMNFVVFGFFVLIASISFDLDILYDLISNSYFIILSTLFELIFMIIPLFYVGKYLQNPTIKNRFTLLGFTFKNFDKKQKFKEILIGLGFAVIGFFLVFTVSLIIESFLEYILGIEIVSEFDSVENYIIPSDILGLLVFSLVMIFVVGTSEEILFRGFMQKGLVRNLGKRWGLIITAFIFSIIHLLGLFLMFESTLDLIVSFLLSFFPFFSISLLLGFLYQWRGENLIAVIITHGFYNTITILIPFIFS